MEKEIRISPSSDVQIVDTTAKKVTIRGYAVLFGVTYDMGWFTEEVAPTAFGGANLSDIRALFNHNPDIPLARTKSRTATVTVNEIGLRYEFTAPRSPNGENVAAAVERGDVDQSSWGFTIKPGGDKWIERAGKKPHRIITAVDTVFDVSPVTFAANPQTSATVTTTAARQSYDADKATRATNTADEIAERMERLQRAQARAKEPAPEAPEITARKKRLANITEANSAATQADLAERERRLERLTRIVNQPV